MGRAMIGTDAAEFRCLTRVAAAVVRGSVEPVDGAEGSAEVLAALGHRHRMAAPVLERLAEACRPVDAGVAARLEAAARRKRVHALWLTAKAVEISRAFSASGVRHLAIKGPALAQALYGDPAARDSKDLDFLIDPGRIDEAHAVLLKLGYRENEDGTSAGRLPIGSGDMGKHRTFVSGDVAVEAHSRLVDVPELFPLTFEDLWAARESVGLGQADVPVPSFAHGVLYLCVHGAEHVWFRLKWLQDIARILATTDDARLAECQALADRLGLEAVFGSALELVDRTFNIRPPAPMTKPGGRTQARLTALSETALASPAEMASAAPMTWLLKKLPVQINLRSHAGYRIAFLRHLVLAPRAFDLRSWPRWARWFYHPMRPLLFLRSRIGEQSRQQANSGGTKQATTP